MQTAYQIMTAAIAKAEKHGGLLPVEAPKHGHRKMIAGKWYEWTGIAWRADGHKISTSDGCNLISHYLTGRA